MLFQLLELICNNLDIITHMAQTQAEALAGPSKASREARYGWHVSFNLAILL